MTDSNTRKQTAFSLIELLMAIAVIALLVMIIVPVVGSVRERADASKCVSNIRQCSTMLLQLASDSNNEISVFRSGGAGAAGASAAFWANQVSRMLRPEGSRHTRVLDVIYCPSFTPSRFAESNSTWAWDCYGMNMLEVQGARTEAKDGYALYVLGIHAVDDPSNHLLLVDSMIVGVSGAKQRFNIRSLAPSNANGGVHLRHGNHANASFLDGHIEALDLGRLQALEFTSVYDANLEVVATRDSN